MVAAKRQAKALSPMSIRTSAASPSVRGGDDELAVVIGLGGVGDVEAHGQRLAADVDLVVDPVP